MTTESDASETAASAVSADVAGEKRKARRARVSVETLPSGTVRVRVRGKRQDGRPFDRSEAFSQGTREERAAAARAAKATLWRWAEEVEAGLVVEEESMTLATLAARLKKDGQAIRLQERSALAGPLRSMQGIDVRELSDAKWAAWVDRQRRAGLSAAYIRKSYHVARKLVGSAVERKWLARLPWAAVSKWLPTAA